MSVSTAIVMFLLGVAIGAYAAGVAFYAFARRRAGDWRVGADHR